MGFDAANNMWATVSKMHAINISEKPLLLCTLRRVGGLGFPANVQNIAKPKYTEHVAGNCRANTISRFAS